MKPSNLPATLATLTPALGLSFSTASQAQEADKLPNYVPVLPQVKARALAVDPQKGYLVKQVKPDVHVITDGIYQSAFVATGKGVILFDAPESFAQHIVKAVAEVTREPIVQLVYSHAHLDHIACAGLLVKQVPKPTIVAEADTAAFLRDKKDARRPLPTSIFKNQRTLKLGTMTVEFEKGQWHSPEGDLLICDVAGRAEVQLDNKFAIFRTLLEGVVEQCAAEIQARWIDNLAGVDVFGASHCRAALIYARWDD